jgi:hypothetical protein
VVEKGRSQDASFCLVTRLQAEKLQNQGSIPDKENTFLFLLHNVQASYGGILSKITAKGKVG